MELTIVHHTEWFKFNLTLFKSHISHFLQMGKYNLFEEFIIYLKYLQNVTDREDVVKKVTSKLML